MNLLTMKITDGDGVLGDIPDHEIADLKKLAQGVSKDTMQRILDILMAEEDDIRRSMEPRINLEYAVVRMAYLEPLIPVDEIISRMEDLEMRLGGGRRQDIPAAQQPRIDQEAVTAESNRGGADEITDGDNLWQELKSFIKEKNPPLSSKIGSGEFLSYEDDCLKIGFPRDYVFLDDIKGAPQMNLLTQMAAEFLGKSITIDIKLLEGDARNSNNSASNAAGTTNNIKNEALRHPLVQKIMDVFEGAEIMNVRVNGSRR